MRRILRRIAAAALPARWAAPPAGRRASGLAICAAGLVLGSAAAAGASPADSFDDYRDGDIVVQDRPGSREAALWAATGSAYTHAGIVRLTGGGPYVLDLDASASEVPVEDFIARGAGSRYAVFRLARWSHRSGAEAASAAWRSTDRRRNLFLAPDRSALYGSQLVRLAYRSAGVTLGRFERVGDLHAPPSRLRSVMMADWEHNPACRSAAGRPDLCWGEVKAERLVTLDSITSDPKVALVHSTFPPEAAAAGRARPIPARAGAGRGREVGSPGRGLPPAGARRRPQPPVAKPG